MEKRSFGVLGGDRRQAALADSIAADGYGVYVCALNPSGCVAAVREASLDEITEKCANIILPIPVTTDGKYLKTEKDEILLDDVFAQRMRRKLVFGGMTRVLKATSRIWETIDCRDYASREEFAVRNAVPTAEGALAVAVREYPGTVNGSRCLVAGFGRIGKVLAWMLRGMGAKVTVSARKPTDLAWAQAMDCRTVPTADLIDMGPYDLIFNTIPVMIFDRKLLSRLSGRPLIIDLASLPGGVDFPAAQENGIQCVRALSLPGKTAPRAAAENIKRTVYSMMAEE